MLSEIFSHPLRYREHPLAYRLLFYILLFSSFFTILDTAFQLYLDYRNDVGIIEERLEEIGASHVPGLSNSLWHYDDQLTEAQLNGILRLPDIQYLEIRTEQGEPLTTIGKAHKKNDVISHQFPLVYKKKNIPRIGTLYVAATLEGVYQRLHGKILVILGTQAVKTFLVSAFIIFIFQYLIARHLKTVARYSQQIDFNHLDHSLTLNRPHSHGSYPDELDQVVNAVNKMRVNLIRDIAARKHAENELRQVKNYLNNIINSMPSVLVGTDQEKCVMYWNFEAEKITGISAKEARGQRMENFFPQLKEHIEKINSAMISKTPQKAAKVMTRLNGDTHYFDIMFYPLIANGVKGVILRMDDVTERVRLEEMLVQSEKMMSVGGLAAGMAHEINNPLGGILQSAQNISRRISSELPKNMEVARECGTDLRTIQAYMEQRGIIKFLDGIRTSGKRAANIINDMLRFSRPGESRLIQVRLAELLDKTVSLAAHDYDLKKKYDFRHIRIVREFEPDLPEIFCVPTEIEQVILNLLRNAAQAMTDKKDNTTLPCIILRLYQDGDMICIEVEDNGPGMDEKNCKRAFEPFFTTKTVGIGTGLGLSVSYFIINNNHKGTMTAESLQGKGTKIIIRLPIYRGENPNGNEYH